VFSRGVNVARTTATAGTCSERYSADAGPWGSVLLQKDPNRLTLWLLVRRRIISAGLSPLVGEVTAKIRR
jgi:hypothetical protein